ncbi:MAG: ferredoxin [Bacillota bacterium]
MAIKPVIDQDMCIGDGICETICPEVFELRDDGLAYVIDEDPSEDLRPSIEEAIEACPTQCISLEE